MSKVKEDSRTSQLLQYFVGWVLYPVGDLAGQIIMGQFSIIRFCVLAVVGGIIYRWEIPRWFGYIEKVRFTAQSKEKYPGFSLILTESDDKFALTWLGKAICAALFFNPLWIARHLIFISCALTPLAQIDFFQLVGSTLKVGTISFFTNLPIALIGNYIIQKHLPLKFRFLGSAVLTTILNAKYAIEYVYFS